MSDRRQAIQQLRLLTGEDRPFVFDGDPFGDGSRRRQPEPESGITTGSEPVPTDHATMAARVAAFFRARPGEWIDGRELMNVAGSYGWRTRISDCRRAPYFMRIDNRQRKVERFTVSEYMFVAEDRVLGGAA
jgi:hypothetical protein